MNFIKIILTIFVFPTVIFCRSLELNIDIEKKEFLKREPITILVEVKNNGSEIINIPKLSLDDGSLKINLIDLIESELLENNLEAVSHSDKIFVELKPGETIFLVQPIVPIYFGNTSEGETRPYYNYLRPGKYSLSLEYVQKHPNSSKEEVLETKKFYSKSIEFIVSEAVDMKDRLLLSSYDSVMSTFNTGSPKLRVTQAELYHQSLFNLLEKYPNSEYRKLVFMELIKTDKYKENQSSVKQTYHKYFNEFPSDRRVLHYLNHDENAKETIKDPIIKDKLSKTGIMKLVEKQKDYLERINKKYFKND